MTTEYVGKEDDVSMLNNDQLARAEALRMARAVLEVRGVGGSFLTPGSIQPGKAYDITSMANWIITGQYGLVAVGPTPVMDYYEDRPQETVVERTEPDDPPMPDVLPEISIARGGIQWSQPDPSATEHVEMTREYAKGYEHGASVNATSVPTIRIVEGNALVDIGWPGSPRHTVVATGDTLKYQPTPPEVNFEIPEDERERQAASGRSAWINIDAVKDTETSQAAPDPEDGWPDRAESAELARSHDEDELP
jgi:hypothetical protein